MWDDAVTSQASTTTDNFPPSCMAMYLYIVYVYMLFMHCLECRPSVGEVETSTITTLASVSNDADSNFEEEEEVSVSTCDQAWYRENCENCGQGEPPCPFPRKCDSMRPSCTIPDPTPPTPTGREVTPT